MLNSDVLKRLAQMEARIIANQNRNQEKIMATLQDVIDADVAVKAELDTIATDVTNLVAENKKAAADLAAAVASNDPAALQAAVDQAHANAAKGEAIVKSFPTAAP